MLKPKRFSADRTCLCTDNLLFLIYNRESSFFLCSVKLGDVPVTIWVFGLVMIPLVFLFCHPSSCSPVFLHTCLTTASLALPCSLCFSLLRSCFLSWLPSPVFLHLSPPALHPLVGVVCRSSLCGVTCCASLSLLLNCPVPIVIK